VKLQDVQVIGSQTPEAGLDVSPKHVLLPGVPYLQMTFVLDTVASALGRQVELVAAGTDVLADSLFADPIVGRRIDEIDARIQHTIEKPIGILLADDAYAPRPRAPQAHAAIAELGYFETGTTECLRDHLFPSILGMIVADWKVVYNQMATWQAALGGKRHVQILPGTGFAEGRRRYGSS
jgi:hypothetical protein